MGLRLYNTLTRKKQEFNPLHPGHVKMYSCGPTVYNYAHLGNLRTYIFNDILRRVLLYNAFKLEHAMNITDVGHLTSDADEGEDKMLLGAKREKKTIREIADFYTEAFFNDADRLNIQRPDIICKATDHIQDMIKMNERIEMNGFAYLAGGNLYFDTSKFKDYSKLGKLKLEALKEGARVKADPNKKNPSDFVLWFTKSKFQDQEMKWDSPWGTGYPGWHIECAAMSTEYLGEQFDIHTGGIDHIPVHHTNEIAQAEAATGKKPWVQFWLHGEFLVMDKEKMAKSKDKFLTLQLLIDKGYDPLDYRYLCLNAHYRSKINFSFQAMDSAQSSLTSLKQKVIEIKQNPGSNEVKNDYKQQFSDAINNDLDMPKAMSVMWAVIRDAKLGNTEKYDLLLDFDGVLGFGFKDFEEEVVDISDEIKQMIEEREQARKKKDWKAADKIRSELEEKGYILEDAPEGPKVKKS